MGHFKECLSVSQKIWLLKKSSLLLLVIVIVALLHS